MNNLKNNIDQSFEERLNDFQVVPPEEVWQAVTSKLDENRKFPSIAIWSGLAAGIALLIGTGWFYQFEHHPKNNISAKIEINKPKQNIATHINQDHTKISVLSKNIGPVAPKTSTSQSGKENSPDLYASNSINESQKALKSSAAPEKILQNNVARNGGDDQSSTSIILKGVHLGNGNRSFIPVIIAETPVIKKELAYQEQPKPYVKRWSIQGQVAPLYAYRNITQTAANVNKSAYDKSEAGLMTYSGGVKINYKASKRFSFQSGIFYSVLGYTNNNAYVFRSNVTLSGVGVSQNSFLSASPSSESKNYYEINSSVVNVNQYSNGLNSLYTVYSPQSFGDNNAFANGNSANLLTKVNGKFVQQMKFIEVPFLVKYRITESKISLNLIGGFGTNILVGTKGYVLDNNVRNNISESPSLHTVNFSSTVGIGINYRLPNQMMLMIEPTYKYFINSVSTNANKIHPYTFGVYTGLNFTF